MKHGIPLISILLISIALPQRAAAYDFSQMAPTGQTLYYNIVDGKACVTSQNSASPYYTVYPTDELTIPSTVTHGGTTYDVSTIGRNAFNGCTGLTSVVVSDGISRIEYGSFCGCSSLSSITFGQSVSWFSYDVFAYFAECDGCTAIVTGHGNDCSGYLAIPQTITVDGFDYTVTEIGERAFHDCYGLTSVHLPATLTTIVTDAFVGCTSISADCSDCH